ncbi:MAG: hypothetical protein H0W88_12750 [Parachlamydiaceae bacterium]|nr:hypothetical protein [Parachlamydiaceae bacterium]
MQDEKNKEKEKIKQEKLKKEKPDQNKAESASISTTAAATNQNMQIEKEELIAEDKNIHYRSHEEDSDNFVIEKGTIFIERISE